MFEEAQSAPGSFRTKLLSQTRGHKNDLEKLKRDLVNSSLKFLIFLYILYLKKKDLQKASLFPWFLTNFSTKYISCFRMKKDRKLLFFDY